MITMKHIYTFFLAGICSLMLVLGTSTSFAQGRVNLYTVSTFSNGYSDISGTGNVWSFGDYNWWRGGTTQLSLPFNFKYDNQTISAGTTMTLNTGGALSFSGAQVYYNVVGDPTYPATLCFLTDYINTGTGDNYNGRGYFTNDNYYQVTGSTGSRVLTIQFNKVHGPGSGAEYDESVLTNIQIKLYEATGVIEYIYQNHGMYVNDWGGTGIGIGLNGFTSPSYASKIFSSGTNYTPSTDIRFTPPRLRLNSRCSLNRSILDLPRLFCRLPCA